MLGVLACPNLPLMPIGDSNKNTLESQVGCLFSAEIGAGAYVQSLDGSPPTKVVTGYWFRHYFMYVAWFILLISVFFLPSDTC